MQRRDFALIRLADNDGGIAKRQHIWQVVREFVLVTLFLGRALRRRRTPPTGGFRTLAFPTGGPRPAERGRRAFAALAITYSPNSYVVDMDQDAHVVVVHTLSPVPPGRDLL